MAINEDGDAVAPSWERLPDETPQAYAVFVSYLDMGPGRTIDDAWRDRYRTPKTRHAPGRIFSWASRYHWRERADAYDRYMRQQQQAAQVEEVRKQAAVWAARREKNREKEWTLAESLAEKAESMLRFPIAQTERRVVERYEDGREKTVVTIVEPGRWNFATAARMIAVASQLARLSSQMETSRARVDLRLIREEAEKLAGELGVDPDELMRTAEQVALNAWGDDALPPDFQA